MTSFAVEKHVAFGEFISFAGPKETNQRKRVFPDQGKPRVSLLRGFFDRASMP
ncbi:MAG: hypothetical protein ACR2J7_03135 [Luteimonas sp.]